jgi:hypothetical protein
VTSQKTRSEAATVSFTVVVSFSLRFTFWKARSCLIGCCARESRALEYNWTTSEPARFPVLVTLTLLSILPSALVIGFASPYWNDV